MQDKQKEMGNKTTTVVKFNKEDSIMFYQCIAS